MNNRFSTLIKTKRCAYSCFKYAFLESRGGHPLCSKYTIAAFSTTGWNGAGSNDKTSSLVNTYKKYEQKYLDYIEKRYPRYYRVNMQVISGAKTTWKDMKYRLHLRKKIREDGISYLELPWKDIMFIRQARRDLLKVTPTLVLCMVPIVFYVVLVVVALRPRLLLSQQFFTAQQQNTFHLKDHRQRCKTYPQILKHLRNTKCKTTADKEMLNTLVAMVVTGEGKDAEDLLRVRDLFSQSLNLVSLQRSQLADICKLLALNPYLQPSFLLRRRLASNLLELQMIDKGIKKDGVGKLELQELQRICFDRGFYTSDGKNEEEFRKWLQNWIGLTVNLSESELPLLGYGAFLLVVNHPATQNIEFKL
ncbi:LETM1 domain-containing protein 1-like [Anneissia japonica]|uniref:LETM1 domain-containing protein 1-like n=1 Tax=Anneissia japonica TaxID=1529436 RepID=UPI0014257C90|nr:LETM1 domain-containing protein 1-like [Anneissia japonica]